MLGNAFDSEAELFIDKGLRPHWSQAGAIVFVTFRTADSIPRDVIHRWEREKADWMERHGLTHGHWSEILTTLSDKDQTEFHQQFNRCREDFLDTCHGHCYLKRPELAQIVADSLLHFDGDRYRMGDFVVMPNHVHLLCVFPNPQQMKTQFDSWLHFTAVKINQCTGERDHFWQQEPFDHLVRSSEQYEYYRTYIAENPQRANLRRGEYIYRRLDG